MSDNGNEENTTAATAQRITVCRCGRICSDYPRCRHPEWRAQTVPGTRDEPDRNEDR